MAAAKASKQPSTSDDSMTKHATLRDAIEEGTQINERMKTYLRHSEWSPAMAFMLAAGIAAKINCSAVPRSGKGLDGQVLLAGSRRLLMAKHYLNEWRCYWEGEIEPSLISPFNFFIWCDDNGIETEWLRQLQALAGFRVSNRFDRTYAAMAMIMDAVPAQGIFGLSENMESNHLRNKGVCWTPERLQELFRYKSRFGLKSTAEKYDLSKARIGQLLKKNLEVSSFATASLWGNKSKR